jgi:hypothetical protein
MCSNKIDDHWPKIMATRRFPVMALKQGFHVIQLASKSTVSGNRRAAKTGLSKAFVNISNLLFM